MKILSGFCWLFLMTMVAMTAKSHAGVESGGGALSSPYPTAWFLSRNEIGTVKTCFVVSEDFGVDSDQLGNAIEQAFQTWTSYLSSNALQFNGNPISSMDGYIATNLSLMTSCDGSEDLKVYFGAKDDQVNAALLQFANSFGFVVRTSDPNVAWGKGFMYIANPSEVSSPSWTTRNHLVGILLHELGHILGCAHLDQTIMAADISDQLSSQVEDHLNQIDQQRMLRYCLDCGPTYHMQIDDKMLPLVQQAFQALTGEKDAQISAVTFTQQVGDARPTGKLSYTVGNQIRSFAIKTITSITQDFIDVPLFKTPYEHYESYSESFLGELQKDDGTVLSIAVNMNDANGYGNPVTIAVLQGNYDPLYLFLSDWTE